jgi:hypothetical protein
MKFLTFDAEGNQREVDGAELEREWREADRRAGPSPTSRDWFPCGNCKIRLGEDVGCEAISAAPAADAWRCNRCHTYYSTPREMTLVDGLTRWQWSIVRHLSCGAFGGHQYCVPDIWLNTLVLSDDGRALESPQLGRLELRWSR